MFKDFVFKKQELSFRNSCFIFAAVTMFVYRYDRMTVSIRIGCPLYRYCIDTDCIVPALVFFTFKTCTSTIHEHHSIQQLCIKQLHSHVWTIFLIIVIHNHTPSNNIRILTWGAGSFVKCTKIYIRHIDRILKYSSTFLFLR